MHLGFPLFFGRVGGVNESGSLVKTQLFKGMQWNSRQLVETSFHLNNECIILSKQSHWFEVLFFLFIYLLFCPLYQLPAHSKSETINIFKVWFYTCIDTYFALHDLHVIAFKYSYVLTSFFRSCWSWCCPISVAIWSQIILTNLTNLLNWTW